MESIVINGEMPKCSECNSMYWTVKQIICRESDLLEVDMLGDLKVSPPDRNLDKCVIVMQCKRCDSFYQVGEKLQTFNDIDPNEQDLARTQELIESRAMAYITRENELSDELKSSHDPEAWAEGLEDGYGWPQRLENNPFITIE